MKIFCRRQAVGVREQHEPSAAARKGAPSGGCQWGRAQPHSQVSGAGPGWPPRAQVTVPARGDEACPRGTRDWARARVRPREVREVSCRSDTGAGAGPRGLWPGTGMVAVAREL